MNPCLLPNWDTVTLKKLSLKRETNRFAITSLIDFGGSGVKSDRKAAKHCRTANFHSLRPSLPFYVNNDRDLSKIASDNCLASCRFNEQNLLLFSHDNKIIGLSLEDNPLIDNGSADSSLARSHRYSSERAVSYGPFRYCTDNVTELFAWDEDRPLLKPVLGLQINNCYDGQQIQTNSRNKLNFFDFSEVEESDLSLDIICEIDIESLRRSDDSMFDNCHRNELIDNQLLISYTKDDVIDLYDMESLETIRSFDSDSFHQKSADQTGLKWSKVHPQMFYYGEFKKLLYCDARQMKPAMKLLKFNSCVNLYNWELFYKFLPSKLDPNQMFVGTDYHVLVIDHRYPKRSLNQFKHMLPYHIIRSIDSSMVKCDDNENEIMICSNLYKNCLMSYSSESNIVQLCSNHSPLHIADIIDIDFYKFHNCYFRGLKLLPSDNGFSVAFLSNVGDIFMQDFFWDNPEVIDLRQSKDITWCKGIGSSNLHIDPETIGYMTIIQTFLEESNCKKVELEERFDLIDECYNCLASDSCKRFRGHCVCSEPKHLTEFFAQERVPEEKEELDFNCEKYFNEDFLQEFDIIENNKLCSNLWEQSADLSKELYALWMDEKEDKIGGTSGQMEEGVT